MKSLYLNEIVKAIDGILLDGDGHALIQNVTTKVNQLNNNTLFFELHRQDDPFPKNSPAAIVTENAERLHEIDDGTSIIKVNDIEKAYWKFVDYYRNLFNLPVIGVTGTCGKTTTKEMIKHILLMEGYRVQATYQSRNALNANLEYLLGIDEETDAAVFEMGVACPGDLLNYCRYFKPQIGIITTIGTDHLQHCGSQENYINEKAKLLEGLDARGTLILNADNKNIQNINKKAFQGKILTFGFYEGADFYAKHITFGKKGMHFTLQFQSQDYQAYVQGIGDHNVHNALAALAASYSAGVDLQRAINRLKSFRPLIHHLQFHKGLNGCTVIDDTWSSNPTSTEAALKVLSEVGKEKKKIVILGKMGLLGKFTLQEHAKIGEIIVREEIDILIAVDDESKHTGMKALEMNMNPSNVYFCDHPEVFYRSVKNVLDKDSVVLIKTSMLDAKSDFIKKMILEK